MIDKDFLRDFFDMKPTKEVKVGALRRRDMFERVALALVGLGEWSGPTWKEERVAAITEEILSAADKFARGEKC